jgi:nucleoid DNA-binding protein
VKVQTYNRREFITRFMRECGLSYVQASRIYDTMVGVFEDGICSGSKIKIGKVGAIYPVRRPPREVSMNFKMGKGRKTQKARHVISLGPRITYKFKPYRQFMATRSLNWFNNDL